MGEAKRRGTLEERVEQAKERKEKEEKEKRMKVGMERDKVIANQDRQRVAFREAAKLIGLAGGMEVNKR
jgi:hypothetical protein